MRRVLSNRNTKPSKKASAMNVKPTLTFISLIAFTRQSRDQSRGGTLHPQSSKHSMSQSKRKAWDATMQATGQIPTRKTAKRASGRTVVLSKSMRVVDEETRNQVKNARLEALEADNYTEEQDVEQDDEFALDEDDDRGDRQRARRAGKSQSGKGKNKGEKDPWKERKFKSLHQVLYELTNELCVYPGGATAISIEAPESKQPPRSFCSVCGYLGLYTCTRCGSRFCSSKCCEQHKETRCLKFAS